MLRASHRVLVAGGRIGGYTIHTPEGLSADDESLAIEYGPSQVTAASSPEELAIEAGFSVVKTVDVTETFLETCQAIWKARAELEAELRQQEGDEAYEQEQDKKRRMAQGIALGLLRRSLIIAVKS